MPPGHVWLVYKPMYGLREAPNLWSEERTDSMIKVRFTPEGEHYSVTLSQIYESLFLIAKTSSLHDSPSIDHLGLTNKVKPQEVVALNGIAWTTT